MNEAEATSVVDLAASTATVIGLYMRTTEELHDLVYGDVELPIALTSLSTRLAFLTALLRTIARQIEANRPPNNAVIALNTVIHRIAIQLSAIKTSLMATIPFVNATQIQRTIEALRGLKQDRNLEAAVQMLHQDINALISYPNVPHRDATDPMLEALTNLRLD